MRYEGVSENGRWKMRKKTLELTIEKDVSALTVYLKN